MYFAWAFLSQLLCISFASDAVVNITVHSAGFNDGNTASFRLNDVLVNFVTFRGLNLIALHRNGTLRFAENFDTHGDVATSKKFAATLSTLEYGTPIAVVARDDAADSLDEVAVNALTSCCFASDFVLEERDSYALVSIVGIAALAEKRVATGSGVADVTGIYQELPPLPGVSVAVRNDGLGKSEFLVDGVRLECDALSVLTLAVLHNNGTLLDCRSFDVTGKDLAEEVNTSGSLRVFIASLPSDTPVLISLVGGHRTMPSDIAVSLVPLVGPNVLDATGNLYVAVGFKGGSALAEKTAVANADSVEVVLVGVSVLSAGFDDGNRAKFVVSSQEMRARTARGLNFVVLNEDGTLNKTVTFDTHGKGDVSADLAVFIDKLPNGTVTLVAVRDDAAEGLDEKAYSALVSIGARSLSTLRSRDSYVVVGAKGHERAMAELRVGHLDGPAVVAAHWQSSLQLPRPHCRVFQCPEGMLLREDAFEVEGNTNTTCCIAAPTPDVISIEVESAGWDDGNFAHFYLDGNPVSTAVGRGLNVVVLRTDGSVESSVVFDTDASGSDSLVAFIDQLAEGTPVLVAAADEAAVNLTDAARDAIRTLGGTKIGALRWRGSYALVGLKWNSALAEAISARGEGPAQIVAHYTKLTTNEPLRPVCDGRSKEPPVKGYLSNGQLKLEAGCRYSLYTSTEACSCLQGAWVVVAGGSNTILMTINLANLLVPGALDPIDDKASMGMTTVIDLVIDGGVIIYKNSVKLPGCTPEPFDDDCRHRITAELQNTNVPDFSPRSTRVTQIVAQYWDHVDAALDAVQAEKRWAQAEVAFLTQVSAWYIYCSVKKVTWCPRHELIPEVDEAGLQVFQKDMAPIISRLEGFCSPSGRAGVRGCVVGTTSWQNPPAKQALWYKRYNKAIKSAVLPIASSTLRVIDFWELGMSMPTECILGHGSPVANIWSWQVMLSGFCKPSLVSPHPYAVFEGGMCFAADAEMGKCPHYEEKCPDTFRCERWECASSEPCTLVAGEPPARKAAAVLNITATVQNLDLARLSSNATMRIAFTKKAKSVIAAAVGNDVLEGDVDVSLQEGSVVVIANVRINNETLLKNAAVEMRKPKAKAALASSMLSAFGQLTGIASLATGTLVVTGVNSSISGDLEASDGDIFPDYPPPGDERENAPPCRRLICSRDYVSQYIATVIGVMLAGCVMAFPIWWLTCVVLLPRRLRDKVSGPVPPNPDPPAGNAEPKPCETRPADVTSPNTSRQLSLPTGAVTSRCCTVSVRDFSPRTPLTSDMEIVLDISDDDQKEQPEPEKEESEPDKDPKQQPDQFIDKDNPVTAATPAKNASNTGAAGDRFPLGMARFCASLHVVVGHLYAKGVTPGIYFFGWGFTWVPWFFMLSGFVLFTAHLRRPKQEGVIEYVLRRSVTIYPLYAVSLIPALLVDWFLGRTPMSYAVLISQSFLAQAWNPMWAEYALQQHCWFLSCMVVYWLCFKPLARCLKDLSLRGTVLIMTALFVLPWLVVVLPAAMHESIQWYKGHSWKATDTWLDLIVVILKFSPICYAHVFILGMLLAKLRLLLDAKATAAAKPALGGNETNVTAYIIPWRYRFSIEFVLPIGYIGLLAVFISPDIAGSWAWASSWGYKLSARLSVLLPFQAAVLFGLAGLPSLPLPRVAMAMKKLDFLQNYSYCVYVLQWLCYDLWPLDGAVNVPLFLVFVVSIAVVVAHTVQKPVERWWSGHPRGRLAVPFILSGMLCLLNAAPRPAHGQVSKSAPDLPAFVRLGNETVDMRMPLVDAQSDGASLINPSIMVNNGEVFVVARRHSLEYRRFNGEWNGSAVTYVDKVWRSQILMSRVEFNADAWSKWPKTGATPFSAAMRTWSGLRNASDVTWNKLCASETYLAHNRTVVRVIVTGPEDAKLVSSDGPGVDVAFSSLPPRGLDGCPSGEAVAQMYLASDVNFSNPESSAFGRRLQCGRTDKAEKNWIPFRQAGQLFFVYTPVPHSIVAVSEDGQCEKKYSTEYEPLLRLLRRSPELEVRGSGQAAFVDTPESTPALPQKHYLAMLHIFNKTSSQYAHFAYRFSPSPPYAILQVSSQLPLMKAAPDSGGPAFAFASGFSVQGNTVVVTYGAGDRDARAFVITLEALDKAHFANNGREQEIAVDVAGQS